MGSSFKIDLTGKQVVGVNQSLIGTYDKLFVFPAYTSYYTSAFYYTTSATYNSIAASNFTVNCFNTTLQSLPGCTIAYRMLAQFHQDGSFRASGTVTATTALKLTDSVANFTTAGVVAGDVAINTTTGAIANVTAKDSKTVLSLDATIFTSIGEAYTVVTGYSYLHVYNVTDAAAVSNSEISIIQKEDTDSNWTLSNEFTLEEGHTYCIQGKCSAATFYTDVYKVFIIMYCVR